MTQEETATNQDEKNLYEPYDAETLAYFERKLIEEKISIQARLQKNSDPVFIEDLRNNFASDELAEKTGALTKHNQEKLDDERKLADVEAALARIEDGSYGLCVECKKRILLARLNMIPTATRCVPCQAERKPERSLYLVKHR